jgi:hypothetical protein
MDIDELESPGTFVDFSWRSLDPEEEDLLPLEKAFALFTDAPRHALTGAILWPAPQPASRVLERRDSTD